MLAGSDRSQADPRVAEEQLDENLARIAGGADDADWKHVRRRKEGGRVLRVPLKQTPSAAEAEEGAESSLKLLFA
jgi:hypothetical protein